MTSWRTPRHATEREREREREEGVSARRGKKLERPLWAERVTRRNSYQVHLRVQEVVVPQAVLHELLLDLPLVPAANHPVEGLHQRREHLRGADRTPRGGREKKKMASARGDKRERGRGGWRESRCVRRPSRGRKTRAHLRHVCSLLSRARFRAPKALSRRPAVCDSVLLATRNIQSCPGRP